MPAIADLVYQTSTTTGTGDFTTSSVVGWRTLSGAFSTGVTPDVFPYFIRHRAAAEWEVGTGHMSAANTLVRDTVIAGSNGTSKVNFSTGDKDISCDIPADLQVQASRQIATQHSLQGGGDLSADRTLSLVGDSASPGNDKFYGTDGSGVRGFYDAAFEPEGRAKDADTNLDAGDYTLVLDNAGEIVANTTSSDRNLTVPPNSAVAFPLNTIIHPWACSTGKITIVQGSGVAIVADGDKLTIGAKGAGVLWKRATDTWQFVGGTE